MDTIHVGYEPRAWSNALTNAIDSGMLSNEEVLNEMIQYFDDDQISEFCQNADLFIDRINFTQDE